MTGTCYIDDVLIASNSLYQGDLQLLHFTSCVNESYYHTMLQYTESCIHVNIYVVNTLCSFVLNLKIKSKILSLWMNRHSKYIYLDETCTWELCAILNALPSTVTMIYSYNFALRFYQYISMQVLHYYLRPYVKYEVLHCELSKRNEMKDLICYWMH